MIKRIFFIDYGLVVVFLFKIRFLIVERSIIIISSKGIKLIFKNIFYNVYLGLIFYFLNS